MRVASYALPVWSSASIEGEQEMAERVRLAESRVRADLNDGVNRSRHGI